MQTVAWLSIVLCFALTTAVRCSPPSVSFDEKGLVSLKYKGGELLQRGDPWVNLYVPVTASGAKSSDPGNCETSFDVGSRTTTASYAWGDIVCSYKPERDRLRIDVTITNRSPNPIWKVEVTLLEVKLPGPIRINETNGLRSDSIDNVPAVIADYGSGTLAFAGETFSEDYLLELDPIVGSQLNAWFLKVGLDPKRASDREHPDMSLQPGVSKHCSISLRFGPGGATLQDLVGDLFAAYAKKFPPALHWNDRRPIAMMFLSSSDPRHCSPTNPRGWLNNQAINVTSPNGLARFRKIMLRRADDQVRSLKAMNAQGMLVWDIEGEEQPQPITFIGDPRMTAKLAPEMDEIADGYFKKFTDAGLRTGVCIRPSRIELSIGVDGKLNAAHRHMKFDPVSEMSAKIAYARKRWGCTLFYVDTNVTWAYSPEKRNDDDSAVLSWPMRADMFRRLAEANPGVLIIPEFQYPGYYSHVSGYRELRSGDICCPLRAQLTYPGAFVVIKVDDEKNLDRYHEALVPSIRRGDILLYPGWFDSPINKKVKSIYDQAAR